MSISHSILGRLLFASAEYRLSKKNAHLTETSNRFMHLQNLDFIVFLVSFLEQYNEQRKGLSENSEWNVTFLDAVCSSFVAKKWHTGVLYQNLHTLRYARFNTFADG